jgi:thiosulfate/3-mercaptopyruvate sulfurtransferase
MLVISLAIFNSHINLMYSFLIQLPHMLPSEKAFSAAVSSLGIYNKDGIVVYDGKGLFSAARVWW